MTSTLAAALKAARSAVSQAAATNDVAPFEAAVASGVSANLCEALAGMLEVVEASALRIGVRWAVSHPAPVGPVDVGFVHAESGLLRQASAILKARTPDTDAELEGVIVKLHKDPGAPTGDVWLATMLDGRVRKVRVTLDEATYKLALEAHDSEQIVTIEGELAREKAAWVLRRPRHLRLAEP